MQLHDIQKEILHKLMLSSENRRYRDLRVNDIENDLFNYHLKTLVQKGLVEKSAATYKLTRDGEFLVEEVLALGYLRPAADKFRLYAHAIILDCNHATRVISRQRLRKPFIGDRGIHGTSVKQGETCANALVRHYKYHLNIDLLPEKLILHGITRKIDLIDNQKVFGDRIHYIFVCNEFKGVPDFSLETAKGLEWRNIDEAIKDEEKSATQIKTLIQILKKIQDKSLKPETFLHTEEIQHIKYP